MNCKVPTPNVFITYLTAISETCFQVFIKYERQNLQKRTATTNICQGFENCIRGIQGLDQTLSYLKDDIIVLFGCDIPQKLQQNVTGLEHIQKRNSYLYSSYLTSLTIISKRYESLHLQVNELLSRQTKESFWKVNSKNEIQTEIVRLKNDFITLAETEMQLLESISSYPGDEVLSLRKMRRKLQDSIK